MTAMRIALLAAAALSLAAPAAAAPLPGSELLVMNDGIRPVTKVRLRPAGDVEHAAWTGDLLAGDAIPVREGRRIDLSRLGLGCQVEVELTVKDNPMPVVGQQDVCSGDPRFWVAFALGLDEPGMGRPGTYAIVVGEEASEPAVEPEPMKPTATPGPVDLNRGLPFCPGDPRCKKK